MEKAGNIFRALLDRRLVEKGEQYAAFFGCWAQIAGDQISAHSEIKDIRKGVVVVEADHPGWIQLIQLRQHNLLDALRRRFPDLGIRALRLQLPRAGDPKGESARVQGTQPAEQPGPEATPGAPAETVSTEEALEQIRDRELRSILERLADGINKRASGES